MLLKLKSISAKPVLLIYGLSIIMMAVFHHHAVTDMDNSDITVVTSTSELADNNLLHTGDDCTLCKTSGPEIHFTKSWTLFDNRWLNLQKITSLMVVKKIIIDSLSQRGPPVAV